MKIALVGPCSPADLASEFYPGQRDLADALSGYRGVPVSELAKGLTKEGHQVSIATLAYNSITRSASFNGPNLELVVHPGRPRPRQCLKDNYRRERGLLAESIRAFNPDIVHAHWTYEFALGALDTGFPCAVTAHDSPYTVVRYFKDAYRTARLFIAQQVAFKAQNLSAVSPYLQDRWRKQMLYRREIEMIPNAVPADVSPPERMPAANPLIITVGDPSALKNIPALINAFATVRKSIPEAELRVVGPALGPRDQMALDTTRLGLASGVTFVGPLTRAQLASEYGRAWLLVHPSLEEAFGLTLVEAISAGVPALGGNSSGAVPFVLAHGAAGWLCDIRDPDAIAKSILDKIRSGPPPLPPGAQSYIRSNFANDIVTTKYLDWYRKILETS